MGRRGSGRPPPWCPQGGLLPAGTGVDTGELMQTSVKRVGTRETRPPPRWCRGEHATTRPDQIPGPRPVTLSRRAAGRQRVFVGASSLCRRKFPGWCVVACHCGGTADGGLFAPQSTCPRFSLGGRGRTCRIPPRACSVRKATPPSASARLARSRRTCCNRGCGTCVVGRFTHWGPPRSDDPISTVQ